MRESRLKKTYMSTAPYSRRRFLSVAGKSAALASWCISGTTLDAALRDLLCRGLIPGATADVHIEALPKPDMIVHSEAPFNAEFPPHLLHDIVTPTSRHFVRNNSSIPERAKRKDVQGWTLTIDGAVDRQLELSMDDLLRFPQVRLRAVLECAGNGRSLFEPKVGGTPWIRGAVGCSEWTGVRLRDVLKHAGLKPHAVYLGNYGEDVPVNSGEAFSRGIPIEKAMDEHTLIALKMNGKDLPAAHGFPARLIVPGWNRQLDAEVAQSDSGEGSSSRFGKDEWVFLSCTVISSCTGKQTGKGGYGNRYVVDREVAYYGAPIGRGGQIGNSCNSRRTCLGRGG